MTTSTHSKERYDVIQVQQGDDLAFTRLVERYQTPVFNLCYHMLGDPDCAEDAAQESFLRAYRNINRFDPERSFAAWLLSITAHYCIDQLRRRKVGYISIDQPSQEDDRPMQLADARAAHPEAALAQREEHHVLHRVLGALKDSDRAVIVLRYWYDMSDAEISETLKISVPAVKSRLFRSRREIASRLSVPERQVNTAFALPFTQPA